MQHINQITEAKIRKAGEDATAGLIIDEITLNAERFGFFSENSVSKKLIRDEIAKSIADKLLLDYDYGYDPSRNSSYIKVSSVVYMKPEYRETLENIKRDLEHAEKIRKEENAAKEELIQELMVRQTYALQKWVEYSDLYFKYLGKDNDWRYLFKRAFHLLYLDIKIRISGIVHWIPKF